MKKIGDPFHGICSKFFSSPSSHLISPQWENYLDSSWEVTFLQLEVEHGLEFEDTSLVASQLVPSSFKGKS
jgi:hypothetical protein